MLTHGRVLRRVLLTCSVLTLTGVHKPEDHLPVGWRVSQLLPISALSLMSLGTLALVWQSLGNIHQVLFYLTLSLSWMFNLLMLIWWCVHRKALHRLL